MTSVDGQQAGLPSAASLFASSDPPGLDIFGGADVSSGAASKSERSAETGSGSHSYGQENNTAASDLFGAGNDGVLIFSVRHRATIPLSLK